MSLCLLCRQFFKSKQLLICFKPILDHLVFALHPCILKPFFKYGLFSFILAEIKQKCLLSHASFIYDIFYLIIVWDIIWVALNLYWVSIYTFWRCVIFLSFLWLLGGNIRPCLSRISFFTYLWLIRHFYFFEIIWLSLYFSYKA